MTTNDKSVNGNVGAEPLMVSSLNNPKSITKPYLRKATGNTSIHHHDVHENGDAHETATRTSSGSHSWKSFLNLMPTLSEEERYQIWQESRLDLNGNEVSIEESRLLTRKNILFSLKLAPSVLSELFALQWHACGFRILFTYLSTTIHGILPAWRAIAMANLMDAVQDALSSSQPVEVKRIMWLAFVDVASSNTATLLDLLFRNNDDFVASLISEKIERMYLESTLLMDIPTMSNPEIRPILFEGGVFAGIESQRGYGGQQAGGHVLSILGVFTQIIQVLSQATILFAVLTSAKDPFSWSNLLFAFMTFLPSSITLIERFAISTPEFRADDGFKRREISKLGQMGPYKQEILLFGLADWVLGKWNDVNIAARERRNERTEKKRYTFAGVNIFRDSLQSIQYALIAIGAFPATVSLGNIRLCQTSANALVSLLMIIQDRVAVFMDVIFHFEAFSHVMRMKSTMIPEKGALRAYETLVSNGAKRGMRLEAKNLSFTYPGQTEPTLKNVNLTIEAGETLAIVGFNGSGKTTLVKVLMGLYNYAGSLTINDHEASTYDRPSLHAKTTVCFQDFSRYDATVKENVGTGNFPRMDDSELLNTALKRGGADMVVDNLEDGLDQLLNRHGTPLDAEPGALGGPKKPKKPKKPMTGRGRLARWMKMHAWNQAINLSGGQWQRVALARAFMRSDEADLVVFDEPSSSLDAVAEHELFERIHGLSRSETGQKVKTTIYVSHRFNTTRKADKIAVVENGTVTEVGSHDELIALGGRYAEFFNLQAQAFL